MPLTVFQLESVPVSNPSLKGRWIATTVAVTVLVAVASGAEVGVRAAVGSCVGVLVEDGNGEGCVAVDAEVDVPVGPVVEVGSDGGEGVSVGLTVAVLVGKTTRVSVGAKVDVATGGLVATGVSLATCAKAG
jgi:hypothetical protein